MNEEPIQVIPQVEKLSLHEIKERVVKIKKSGKDSLHAFKVISDKVKYGQIIVRNSDKPHFQNLRQMREFIEDIYCPKIALA